MSQSVRWWSHPRSKKVITITFFMAIAGVVIWLIWFRPYVSTDDARIATTLIRVAPEGAGGRVIKLAVREGDQVKKDDILLELDHGVAEANLEKAKAKSGQSISEYKRIQQLAAQHGITPRDAESARSAAEMAEADLKLAQIAYDRTFLKSTIDGIVVQKATEEGNILETNQTALTLSDFAHAWVGANIEETRVGDVEVGQLVTIHVDEGGTLRGKVAEIRAATASQFALIQADNPSGNFTKLVQRIPVKIEIEPHEGRVLRAGQSVEIKIKVR